jgi:flagellar basal-body rod protein FlgB
MPSNSPLGFNYTNDVIAKALDGHWARHEAISSNLANVETPGYKRKAVHFEGQLRNAIQRHNNAADKTANNQNELELNRSHFSHAKTPNYARDLGEVEPSIVVDDLTSTRSDENGVDVEIEMVTLAENTEHFLALNNLQGRMLRGTKGVLNNVQG